MTARWGASKSHTFKDYHTFKRAMDCYGVYQVDEEFLKKNNTYYLGKEDSENQTSASDDETLTETATTVPESAIETVPEPESIDDTVKSIIARFEGKNHEIELTDDIKTVAKLKGAIANKLNLVPKDTRIFRTGNGEEITKSGGTFYKNAGIKVNDTLEIQVRGRGGGGKVAKTTTKQAKANRVNTKVAELIHLMEEIATTLPQNIKEISVIGDMGRKVENLMKVINARGGA